MTRPTPSPRPAVNRAAICWVLFLFGLFVFRTAVGLCQGFWRDDEKQVYLIGLKYFTTGSWPAFGPDVYYTQSQIPGALQGLLVGLPLYLVPVPEAPIVFLNILSFAALVFFAWYLSRRFPDLPRWVIYAWVMTCPWVMSYSTHIINPSYELPFAILFFIGLFETLPLYRERLLPASLCFFMMGLATTCIMQVHMSWVLLVPLAGAALVLSYRAAGRSAFAHAGYLAVGFAVGLSTLLPTLILYGPQGSGGVEQNLVIDFRNAKHLVDVIMRFLAFATFEVPRFIGPHTVDRIAWLRANPWVAPTTVIIIFVGFAQAVYFLVCFFLKNASPEWNRVRWLVGATVLMTYFSFFLSIKGPASTRFYLLFPLAMWYSFFCYRKLSRYRRWWEWGAGFLLLCGVLLQARLALIGLKTNSLYTDRARVVEAITKKDYRIVGLRRADEWGHGY